MGSIQSEYITASSWIKKEPSFTGLRYVNSLEFPNILLSRVFHLSMLLLTVQSAVDSVKEACIILDCLTIVVVLCFHLSLLLSAK